MFDTVGVNAKIYRMRDVYRSGQLDAAMQQILDQVDKVRKVYSRFSRHKNDLSSWYPFQPICEKCHKIGTTRTYEFDGKEVTYRCEPNLVTWAAGCGNEGKVTPFGGNGKLPWKLEWIAKWHSFNVGLEGAGKDHCTKGGSRDVADQCYSNIFGKKPPINVPYEFFLLEGAKMSSSKGVGFYAQDIVNFLPPEIVRFLMVRQNPKKTVNFSVAADYTVKLFNEYDQMLTQSISPKATEDHKKILTISALKDSLTSEVLPSFQLLMALKKMPHMNVTKTIMEKHHVEATNPQYIAALNRRVESVGYWIDHFADPDDLLEIQMHLPDNAMQLAADQRAFLYFLAKTLSKAKIPRSKQTDSSEIYQTLLFDVARMTPIKPDRAFQAFYCALLNRDLGPKGGSLIAYLGPKFVAQRLQNIPYSKLAFWRKTAIMKSDLAVSIAEYKDEISKIEAHILSSELIDEEFRKDKRLYVLQCSIYGTNNKIYAQRCFLHNDDELIDAVEASKCAELLLSELKQKFDCDVQLKIIS